MRLLCYVLLLIAIVVATTTSAVARNQDQQELSERTLSDPHGLTRFLNADDDTRQLRGTATRDVLPNDEERAMKLPSSISKLFAGVSERVRKMREGFVNRMFGYLDKKGYDPTTMAKILRIDDPHTPARNVKFYEKFTAYWIKKHGPVNAAA
ncbi:hypothetical protein PHYBOEH_009172 [Phytophthora boehmeriae]|uniref:RxLR effector protein n=1 Tax=Phytophthora boehmeriae TaxID=109152 RepID=A0A8T1VUZ8_9STRA|nr:hypothetical protein PHYBOEH_009172 [Phytophthora boehmeriae]